MAHPILFILYLVAVSVLFALLGIVVGLWADGFEQLAILSTFIITPLSFLGGMFNTLAMLPESLRIVVLYNPFFYFIDGMRYAMTDVHEAPLLVGGAVILLLTATLFVTVVQLFRRGWRLRA
jgi:ABC-2 type transport system permease protein